MQRVTTVIVQFPCGGSSSIQDGLDHISRETITLEWVHLPDKKKKKTSSISQDDSTILNPLLEMLLV